MVFSFDMLKITAHTKRCMFIERKWLSLRQIQYTNIVVFYASSTLVGIVEQYIFHLTTDFEGQGPNNVSHFVFEVLSFII